MAQRTDNLAKPGDRVVMVSCCNGKVLVRESSVPRWECGRCYGPGHHLKLFQFSKDMELVELSLKEARSYR